VSTALVTGATAGIGREFAEQLAARGHDLVLVARDVERLEQAATELRERHGVAVEVLPADLSDRAALQRVADRVGAAAPDGGSPPSPVDILVNNAGYGLATPFLETDVEDEERLLDVLVRAVLVLSHAAAGSMTGRGRGQIINVSSVAGFITSGTYAAAKSYVTVFTESLSSQLNGTGVTATALCPGFVVTEFHQRAGIDRGSRTGPFWLDAKDLVRDALADADRGRAVSIPSPQYKVLVTALRHLPRAVVRNPAILAIHRRR
jgi:short-subunit dehydrogenase